MGLRAVGSGRLSNRSDDSLLQHSSRLICPNPLSSCTTAQLATSRYPFPRNSVRPVSRVHEMLTLFLCFVFMFLQGHVIWPHCKHP